MDTQISTVTLYDGDCTTSQRPEVNSLVENELEEKSVHLPLDTILKLVLGPDMEMKSNLEKLVSYVQEEEEYRIAMQVFLEACGNWPSQSHEHKNHEHFVKLVNAITGFVYHFDSDLGYKTLIQSQQPPADWCTTGRDTSAFFCWDLKGKDDLPSRVPKCYTRKVQELPSSNRDTSLKRPIDAISDHGMAVEPDAKRARISEGSDILSATIPHVDNIALETESCSTGTTRAHKIGIHAHPVRFCLQLNSLELLYYDRSSIVLSGLLDIRDDPAKFIAMLIALLRLTPERRGIPPIVKDRMSTNFADGQQSAADPNGVFVGVKLIMPYDGKEVTVTLGRILNRQTVVLGRGSCIVEASCKSPGLKNMELVLKISFPPTTRQSEVDILNAITSSATEGSKWVHLHLRKMFSFLDGSALEDGPAGRLYNYFQDQNIRFKDDNNTFSYEKRVMRLILLEKLTPVDRLREPRDYAQVFFDVLQIHRWVYDVPQILHRDLSQGNIMVRRDSKGQFRGVLNDWDLSSYLKDIGQGATSQFRTGTRPFMAHELHKIGPAGPPMHRYRHDLESLFFIMAIIFCRHSLNADSNSPRALESAQGVDTFDGWDAREDPRLLKIKRGLLSESESPSPLRGFESFDSWIEGLHEIFFQGITRSMVTRELSPDLFLSNVTYDAFFAVMAIYEDTYEFHTPCCVLSAFIVILRYILYVLIYPTKNTPISIFTSAIRTCRLI